MKAKQRCGNTEETLRKRKKEEVIDLDDSDASVPRQTTQRVVELEEPELAVKCTMG